MPRCLGLLLCCLCFAGAVPLLAQPARDPLVQGKTLTQWIRALQTGNLLQRVQAVNALRLAGPEARSAVPALLGSFRDREASFLHALAALTLSRIGKDAVPPLRQALTDPAESVRAGAALSLGLLGPAALPAARDLVTSLKDRSAFVRQSVAQALGRMGSSARTALPSLRSALEDSDPGVRVEAATAIWRLAGEVRGIPVLTAALTSANLNLARQAAAVLGDMGTRARDAAGALRAALPSKDLSLRLGAAEALFRVTGDAEAAFKVIDEGVKSTEQADRRAAVAALAALGGQEKAIARLTRYLADADADLRREAASALAHRQVNREGIRQELESGLEDPDVGVRWWCALALASSGLELRKQEKVLCRLFRFALVPTAEGESDLPLILDVQNPGLAGPALAEVLKGRSTRLRIEAARTLGQPTIDPQQALSELLENLSEDKMVRRAAAVALGTFGTEARERLRKLLDNTEGRIREGAARALGQMGLPARQVVGALTGLLNDPDGSVRTQAALALWGIDQRADLALPALNLVLKDLDASDRWEAVEAIGFISVEARPAIRGVTEVLVQAVKDRDIRVRMQAAKWLWRRNRQGKVVVPLLREGVSERDTQARQTALETLAELDADARAVPLVLPALTDRDVGVRLAVIEGLVRGGAGLLPQLAEALKSKEPAIRLGVTQALALMGKPAFNLIRERLLDDEESVRTAAEQGLHRCLTGQTAELREFFEVTRAIRRADAGKKAGLMSRREKLIRKLNPAK